MLETSVRSSSTTTPAESGPECDDETKRYLANVSLRFYRPDNEGENDNDELQLFEEVLDDTMMDEYVEDGQ